MDADSRELQNLDVVFPWERRIGAAEAIEVPGAEDIAIVRGDGAVIKMNVATQGFAETPAHPVLPNRIPPAAWPSSPDGSRVHLGYNNEYERSYDNRFYLDYGRPPNLRPNNATAGEFRVLDTRNWRKIGRSASATLDDSSISFSKLRRLVSLGTFLKTSSTRRDSPSTAFSQMP